MDDIKTSAYSGALFIRSGGQSGVDRAALDVALRLGLPAEGWCPKGGWAEDFPEPPGLLSIYPFLSETPSKNASQRTEWNVRDSDLTFIFHRDESRANSPGTQFTVHCAKLHQKPLHILDIGEDNMERTLMHACDIIRASARSTTSLRLNIAGPRESEDPGIYSYAYSFLERLLSFNKACC